MIDKGKPTPLYSSARQQLLKVHPVMATKIQLYGTKLLSVPVLVMQIPLYISLLMDLYCLVIFLWSNCSRVRRLYDPWNFRNKRLHLLLSDYSVSLLFGCVVNLLYQVAHGWKQQVIMIRAKIQFLLESDPSADSIYLIVHHYACELCHAPEFLSP